MSMDSAAEIAAGVLVELVVAGILLAVLYRNLAGRFLIPKREMVLPDQRGVIVAGDRQLRTVEPGRCWVRPGQKLLLCDVRPRKLQVEGFEAISSDGAVLRFSVSGQYAIADPMAFLHASGNAGDALYFDLRRLLTTMAREQSSFAITSGREAFCNTLSQRLSRAVEPNGLSILSLELWDLFQRGWLQRPDKPSESVGLVH